LIAINTKTLSTLNKNMDNEQTNQQARINPNMKEKDQEVVKQILAEYDLYSEQSEDVRNTWNDCYKAYKSLLANTDNPYLSNLSIPKAHEATELLTSFLVGIGQMVRVTPGSKETSTAKADFVQKLMQYQWEEELNAEEKIETWAKEGILLGTSVMKVGWLDNKDQQLDMPFIECVQMSHFYADYFTKEMQEQHSVIHEIIRKEEDVKNDATYSKSEYIEFVQAKDENTTEIEFAGDDNVSAGEKNVIKKVRLLEHWTTKEIKTIAKTKEGWVILRKDKNPYGFIPFVVFRYKTSPLPNRFYGIGAIEPALKILEAINSTVNQMFDNITLINQKGWIIRRGANINPTDLLAKPGWVVTCSDPRADIMPIEISDIKQSIEMLYQKLDMEFQQATGAIDLLKGIPGADTATEAALGQKNASTLLDRVVQHYRAGLKELGRMLAKVNLKNITTNKTIKVMETNDQDLWLEVLPEELDGDFKVEFTVDRTTNNDKIIMSKQLIDFLTLIANDPNVQVDRKKLYKKWLELQGFYDVDFFFEEQNKATQMAGLGGQIDLGASAMPSAQSLPGNQAAGQTAEAMAPVMTPTGI
jgi:hypothetical protein